ncbi:MAG: hypothetical protein JXQ83_04410, partial [Candidatus Glassbacteria bacterium]|nr:hypothetical protein [Candidatus Glassbacteria bacterium]
GRSQEAAENFRKVVAERDTMRVNSAYRFYLGKALEKLGRNDEAREVYQGLLAELDRRDSSGEDHLSGEAFHFDPDRNPEALNHFKRSLALEGLGRKEEAAAERNKAVGQDSIVALRAFSPPRAGW